MTQWLLIRSIFDIANKSWANMYEHGTFFFYRQWNWLIRHLPHMTVDLDDIQPLPTFSVNCGHARILSFIPTAWWHNQTHKNSTGLKRKPLKMHTHLVNAVCVPLPFRSFNLQALFDPARPQRETARVREREGRERNHKHRRTVKKLGLMSNI